MSNLHNKTVELDRIEKRLKELVEAKDFKGVRVLLSVLNEVDVADLIDTLDDKTGAIIYRTLPKDMAGEVFYNLSYDQQEEIVRTVSDTELKSIIEDMYMDDKVDLLEEVDSDLVDRILKYSSPEDRKLINQFLQYPEDSAGSIMTIEYISLKKEMTVKEALHKIKTEGIKKETVYTLYITDQNRKLEGIVSLRELIVASPETKIIDLMNPDVIYLNTHDSEETVAETFKRYGFEALPVCDKENKIVGIITVDDILNLMQELADEDFQIMAAITPNDEEYLETSVITHAKHRIIWLFVLMISASITQRIINGYEGLLASTAFLSGFIPMLMGAGGNSGSQSSTLVIRGLGTGEIETRDWLKIVFKELQVAIICGLALAVVNYFKIIYIDGAPANIALTVSLTLIGSVTAAKLLGGLLPLVAYKLKMDPAIMASPLITTIADATTLVVYFTLASNIIGF